MITGLLKSADMTCVGYEWLLFEGVSLQLYMLNLTRGTWHHYLQAPNHTSAKPRFWRSPIGTSLRSSA